MDNTSRINQSNLTKDENLCSIHAQDLYFECIDQRCLQKIRQCCFYCVLNGGNHESHRVSDSNPTATCEGIFDTSMMDALLRTKEAYEHVLEIKKQFQESFDNIIKSIFDDYLLKVLENFNTYVERNEQLLLIFLEKELDQFIQKNPPIEGQKEINRFIYQNFPVRIREVAELIFQSSKNTIMNLNSIIVQLQEIKPSHFLKDFDARSFFSQDAKIKEEFKEQENVISSQYKGVVFAHEINDYVFKHIIEDPLDSQLFLAKVKQFGDKDDVFRIVRGNVLTGEILKQYDHQIIGANSGDQIVCIPIMKLFCVSNFAQQRIYVYDIQSQSLITEIQTSGKIGDMIALCDDCHIVTAEGEPSQVVVYSVLGYIEQMFVDNKEGGTVCLGYYKNQPLLKKTHHDIIYSGDDTGQVREYWVYDRRIVEKQSSQVHNSSITTMNHFSEEFIVTVGIDQFIQIVETKNLTTIQSIPFKKNDIWRDIMYFQQNQSIVTVNLDCFLEHWYHEKEQKVKELAPIQLSDEFASGQLCLLQKNKILAWNSKNSIKFWKIIT